MCFKYLTALSLALPFILAPYRNAAWAHAYPAVSVPANNATLKEPPREVRIQFTEGVEIEFSQISVKGPGGELVSDGKLRRLGDDTVVIGLKALRPGNYTIEWQVLSVDTHVTDGVLRFSVSGGGK
ncbi:MAG TPA: copper resistance CopC family protein [Candidatus Binatia bacterium]|jgi:hypothetical protein